MDWENKTTKLERKVEIAEMVEKVGRRTSETMLLLQNTTKKYYEISQKHIESTEHMCYSIDRVLRNSRAYAMDNYMEDWIGIEAAASYLDVTKDTVRNWIKKTDMPAHKIGKLWKFKRVELDAWIKSGRSAIE